MLQTLDEDSGLLPPDKPDGKIVLLPEVVECFENHAGLIKSQDDWGNQNKITTVLEQTLDECADFNLAIVSAAEAEANRDLIVPDGSPST